MYEKFFNLHRTPFSMVPDSDCVHVTGQHADVISGAVFGILERRGCVVLTGEAGLGKTTALRAISELLADSNAHTSIISHPTLDASEFLELTMLNFGIPQVAASKAQRLKVLEKFLTTADAAGNVSVLIVDEAHKLPPDALEEVRLLGNFETGNHKLLQILLVGQNELNTRLDLPELWQLKQRIAFRLSLNRLNHDGVEDYMAFRWTKAGGGELPFDADAVDSIAAWSHGIPRVINAICDNSLMLALSDSVRNIGVELIQEVCRDLHLATPPVPRRLLSLREHAEARGAAADVPVLVRKAAAGGSSQQSASVLAQNERKFNVQNLSVPQAPSPDGLALDTWSQGRPSLLKRWLGLVDGQKSATSHKNSDLISLKHHL